MSVKQLSVFVENKMGKVSDITAALSAAGVNLRAVSLADTADFGIMRMIVSDIEKAEKVLEEKHFLTKVNEVLGVELSDALGSLDKVLALLTEGSVNIEYMYSFNVVKDSHAYIVIRVADNAAAEKLLAANGIKVLGENEVAALS